MHQAALDTFNGAAANHLTNPYHDADKIGRMDEFGNVDALFFQVVAGVSFMD